MKLTEIYYISREAYSRSEMYIGHSRLCVCVTVHRRMSTLLHGAGCHLGEWYEVPSSCALLGGFAIGARVSLPWQHSAGREMSASACTRSMPGFVLIDLTAQTNALSQFREH